MNVSTNILRTLRNHVSGNRWTTLWETQGNTNSEGIVTDSLEHVASPKSVNLLSIFWSLQTLYIHYIVAFKIWQRMCSMKKPNFEFWAVYQVGICGILFFPLRELEGLRRTQSGNVESRLCVFSIKTTRLGWDRTKFEQRHSIRAVIRRKILEIRAEMAWEFTQGTAKVHARYITV